MGLLGCCLPSFHVLSWLPWLVAAATHIQSLQNQSVLVLLRGYKLQLSTKPPMVRVKNWAFWGLYGCQPAVTYGCGPSIPELARPFFWMGISAADFASATRILVHYEDVHVACLKSLMPLVQKSFPAALRLDAERHQKSLRCPLPCSRVKQSVGKSASYSRAILVGNGTRSIPFRLSKGGISPVEWDEFWIKLHPSRAFHWLCPILRDFRWMKVCNNKDLGAPSCEIALCGMLAWHFSPSANFLGLDKGPKMELWCFWACERKICWITFSVPILGCFFLKMLQSAILNHFIWIRSLYLCHPELQGYTVARQTV